jgi:fluoride ion exporter CrcB/FEX
MLALRRARPLLCYNARHPLCCCSIGLCGCLSTYSSLALELNKLDTRAGWIYALATLVASQVRCRRLRTALGVPSV